MDIRILSYNIQRGIHLDGLLRLFDDVAAFRAADVVAIQEASFLPDGRNVLAALADVLSPSHVWSYKTVMTYPDKEYGNGFLFRDTHEVLDAYAVPLPQVARLRWYEKQKTEGGRPDTKSAFVQCFRIAGQVVRIANVHLDFAGGAAHRDAQVHHLLAAMADREFNPAGDRSANTLELICGDFNTVGQYRLPASRRATRTALQSATARGYADTTRDLGFTSDLFGSIDPADPAAGTLNFGKRLGIRFRQKTDHILARGHAAASRAGIVPLPTARLFEVSDHLPLEVVLASVLPASLPASPGET